LVDVVGLSVYPQLHPLGTAADRVLSALDTVFPSSRIAVTELGYGAEDLNAGPWWFGSASDPVVARTAVAEHVTGAALGRSDAWGAPFWWYYLEDQVGTPGGKVAPALAAASNGF
ncbi:Tat pathway signal sequence, partial [Actinomyces naeslundii]